MTEDGNVDFWNAGAERMFGYTAGDIVGNSASVLFTPEDRAAGAFERVARTGTRGGRRARRAAARAQGWPLFFCSGVDHPPGRRRSSRVRQDRARPHLRSDAADACSRQANSGLEARVAAHARTAGGSIAASARAGTRHQADAEARHRAGGAAGPHRPRPARSARAAADHTATDAGASAQSPAVHWRRRR